MSFRLVSAVIFAIAASVAVTPAVAATRCPSHVDVRNVMTVSQFDQAGLDKLSKQQLAALNAWLSRYIRQFCAPSSRPVPAATGPRNGGETPYSPPLRPQAKGKTTAAPAPTSAQVANFGAPPKSPPQEPGRIESRIVGDFHGWTGNTIFRLENGQVWKQAGPGYFQVNMENPKVTIKKLLIGYVLIVKGYAKEVFVRRIR